MGGAMLQQWIAGSTVLCLFHPETLARQLRSTANYRYVITCYLTGWIVTCSWVFSNDVPEFTRSAGHPVGSS